MMKNFKKQMILLTATAVTVVGLVGCGNNTTEEGNTDVTTQEVTTEATTEISGETVGNILLQDFKAKYAANNAITAQEMADGILANSIIQFGPATAPIQEGTLMGFGNAKITGFKDGVMFAPMIGSIPFVGYVFSLEDGTDADAFVQVLKDNADPRWNICVEAEETVVDYEGNMVFFVMCPAQFE